MKYDEEMNICLLESNLETSKSHGNVVIFDENVSHLPTSMNLYKRKEVLYELLGVSSSSSRRSVQCHPGTLRFYHFMLSCNSITLAIL